MKYCFITLLLCFSVSSFSQNYKFGKVSKEELEEKFHSLDSSASAAYLYSKRRTHYSFNKNKGFQIVNEIHKRIKIYNKEGFDKATQTIPFYKPESGEREKISSVEAVAYNLVNGKVTKTKVSKKDMFEEQVSKYYAQKKIAFPEIDEGTIIELSYKMVSPYQTIIDDLQFQHDIPVKKMECAVEIPEFYNFNQQAKGYYLIPPERSVQNRSATWTNRERGEFGQGSTFSNEKVDYKVNVQKYSAENIPALKNNEAYVYNMNNYRGGIAYEINYMKFPNSSPKFFTRTWQDVSNSIYEGLGSEISRNSYYKSDLTAIAPEGSDATQKTVKIFQFVKEKVKWNGYSSVFPDKALKKAYKEGSGNAATINLMLVSMLRSAGLEADPVLVSTRDHGVPLFPSRKGFNYIVAAVSLGDGYVVMDATEPYSLPNMLPPRAVNWQGRLIKKDGSSQWLNLGSGTKSIEDDFMSVKLDADGMMEGMMRTKFSNLGALEFRNRFNQIKEEELISRLEDEYNIEIDEFKLANKFDVGKPVVRSVKFSSEDMVEEINGKMYVRPLLFQGYSSNPFKLNERKFPIEFSSPWKEKSTVSIMIPEGYSVESAPETKAFALPENMGIFKYQVQSRGNTIKIISSLEFNQAIIPANYYETLKGFFGQLVKKQSEKIVLTKA